MNDMYHALTFFNMRSPWQKMTFMNDMYHALTFFNMRSPWQKMTFLEVIRGELFSSFGFKLQKFLIKRLTSYKRK